MPAPDAKCFIIPGSKAELFIAQDPSAATLEWLKIGDLDNYTLTSDSTDTSLNTGGWIRSLPMERGMSLTATGRLSTEDPGQLAVDETALETGCDALAFYRFLIPGPREGDPPYRDIGFWAWANKQDTSAASTDPFSWGVELRFWSKPVNLDQDGQVKPEDLEEARVTARAAARATAAAQRQSTPTRATAQTAAA